MNMQTKLEGEVFDQGAVNCAMDLLVVALDIIDYLPLPGDIGEHLDHAVNLLRQAGGKDMLSVADYTH